MLGTAIDVPLTLRATANGQRGYGRPMRQDWYCDEVIPGRVQVDVLVDTDTVFAFRTGTDRAGLLIEFGMGKLRRATAGP